MSVQQTISRPQEVSGFGLFGGADSTLRFLPAPENHGIVFERTDLAEPAQIAALIENVVPQPRRTVLGKHGVTIETVEHVLAALAGLQIDNCLIQIDGPECPGCDGSALPFAEALFQAEITRQTVAVRYFEPATNWTVADQNQGQIAVTPHADELWIRYELDYGQAEIPPQTAEFQITPETFTSEIAFARTFILESEIAMLRQRGYGTRVTPHNVLIFGKTGVVGNSLRCANECARHKLLDCLGDFSLSGGRLQGAFAAHKSGHQLNHEVARRLQSAATSPAARLIKAA